MYSCMHARTNQASDRDTITPDQNLVLEQTGPWPQALPAATLFAFLMFGTARRSVALHCDEYVEVATAVTTASDPNLTRPSMSRIRASPNAGNRHMELERCLTLYPYGRIWFQLWLIDVHCSTSRHGPMPTSHALFPRLCAFWTPWCLPDDRCTLLCIWSRISNLVLSSELVDQASAIP